MIEITKEFLDALSKIIIGTDEEKKSAKKILVESDPDIWKE